MTMTAQSVAAIAVATDPLVLAFADAMSELAGGIVLVTCRVGDRPWGMTVTAFASVSAEPPTVLVSLGSKTASARAIAASGSFGVSILAEGQVDLACLGSAPGRAKFLEPFVDATTSGASPAIAGAVAHLDCRLAEAVRVADHTIFVGRVHAAETSRGERPLVYHRRTYRTFERSLTCLSS